MNNLYYDYIGAKGNYEIVDYIDNTSNILDTKINLTSNFLRGYTDTNITILDNKYNNLIREIPDNSLTNLYINNSNIGGEIRFFVKQSGIFDINNASGQPYRVKIGADGKLYLYYNYNVAIGLFETERWVEPINELIGHKVAITNLVVITGATDIAVSKLIIDVNQLNSIVITDNIITNADRLILRDTSSIYGQLKIVFEKIKNQFTYANAIYAGIVGSLGFGAVFTAYGYIQSKVNADYIENNLKYQLSSNTVMTPAEKQQLKTDTFEIYNSNINDMINYSCNLNIIQGFINSNIITAQNIPKINTNEITLNGYLIQNVLLPRAGGSLTGSISIDLSTIAIPSVGYFGGTGDRIVFYQGSPSVYPFSIGISSASLWRSVPDLCTHDWYVNGVKTMNLNKDGRLILSGNIPSLQLISNGNNLAYATANGYFSTSAIAGDIVLRATNNLILQSKDGGAALTIDKTNNYVTINTRLNTNSFYYNNVELNVNISNVATTTILSSTPNVQKKYMISFTCSTAILMPNNITYYKYDIDLTKYTQLKYIPNPNTPYRIFKIKLWMANGYFEYQYQGKYNVLTYEIYMSNESQAGGGGMGNAGINIRAFGFPENTDLNSITATQIILVRSSNFNFLSCLSIFNTALVYAIIEDCLF